MIVVTAPDGSAVNFPDGTSESTIHKAMMDAFSPQPENSIAGSLKSIGAGLAEGAIDLAGLPADAANLLTKGSDYLASVITGQETKSSEETIVDKLGSENIKKTVEGFTGKFYEPQTATEKFLKTGASFAPAALAGPGGIGRRVATQAVIPGVASEAAGQLTEGTEAEPYARIAGALTGAIGGARAAQAATRPAVAPVPNNQQIANATRASGYQHPAAQALEIDTAGANRFVDRAIQGLQRDRFSERQAGQTYDLLNSLRAPEFGATHRLRICL